MYNIVGDKGDGVGGEGGGWGVVRHWKTRGIWGELFQIETRGMRKRSLVSALTECTKWVYEIERHESHLEFAPTMGAEGVFACPKYPRMWQCKLKGRTMVAIPDVRAGTMGNLVRSGEKAINGNICTLTYELLDDL